MKIVVVVSFLLTLMSLVACQDKPKGYVIEGTLEGAPKNGWVYLTDQSLPIVCYDSVQLKDGYFKFEGKVETPELRYITYFKDPAQRIYGWQNILMVPVYVENSKIRVSLPFSEMPRRMMTCPVLPDNLKVEGSFSHDLFVSYKKQVDPLIIEGDNFNDLYVNAYYDKKGTKEDVMRGVKGMDEIGKRIYEIGVEFIRQHPDSPVALFIGRGLNVRDYGREEAKKIAALFPDSLKVTPEGEMTMKALLEQPLYVGDVLPDFEVLNTDLQKVRLSELVKKGHYMLVELWASWCNPCRADIPHLKEAYQRYHGDGFEMISVSIDDDTKAWEKAVNDEKMEWTQVCGANGMRFDKECMKLFGINAIPACVFVDKEGRVLSLEARGGWLDQILVDLFGR